jgi:hypothetical protein
MRKRAKQNIPFHLSSTWSACDTHNWASNYVVTSREEGLTRFRPRTVKNSASTQKLLSAMLIQCFSTAYGSPFGGLPSLFFAGPPFDFVPFGTALLAACFFSGFVFLGSTFCAGSSPAGSGIESEHQSNKQTSDELAPLCVNATIATVHGGIKSDYCITCKNYYHL